MCKSEKASPVRSKQVLYLLICTLYNVPGLYAQEAFCNSGDIRIHEDGHLGFHTHFINRHPFESNLGLVGFYENVIVSGTFVPSFNSMEVHDPKGIELSIPVEIRNTMNFILGDIHSPGPSGTSALRFMGPGIHSNAKDISKVRGVAEAWDQREFVFPVGDSDHLHALKFSATEGPAKSRCSYHEGLPPGTPVNTAGSMGREFQPEEIDRHGYWNLQSTGQGRVTLYWSNENLQESPVRRVEDITLAGWNNNNKAWEILGPVQRHGDLNQGSVVSGIINPNAYGPIVLAYTTRKSIALNADNYLLTPNGDGINDFLELPAGESSRNNTISIYNREGIKVFEQENYSNQFNGNANVSRVWISTRNGLPKGIYYYFFNLKDMGIVYQGFLYLER